MAIALVKSHPPPHDVPLIFNLPIRAFTTVASATMLVAVVFASIACGGSSGGSSSTGSGSPVGLLSEDVRSFVAFDVKSIVSEESPEKIRDDFLDEWAGSLEGVGIFVEDLETIVQVGGSYVILKGSPSLTDLRGELEEHGFEESAYTGYEVWNSDTGYQLWDSTFRYLAILDDSTVLMGSEDWVKDVIRGINRESGLVMHADDSRVAEALDKAGSGWFTLARDCGDVSELRGCEFAAGTFARGDESFEIKLTYAFLFRSERMAETSASDVERAVFDSGEDVYVESLTTDGPLVIMEAIFYEDDLEDEYGTLW